MHCCCRVPAIVGLLLITCLHLVAGDVTARVGVEGATLPWDADATWIGDVQPTVADRVIIPTDAKVGLPVEVTIGNGLLMGGTATLKFRLRNPTYPSLDGCDHILYTGGTLTLARLELTIPTTLTLAENGATYTLIDNQTGSALGSHFTGLPEGSILQVADGNGPLALSLSYQGGDGNDAVLTILGRSRTVTWLGGYAAWRHMELSNDVWSCTGMPGSTDRVVIDTGTAFIWGGSAPALSLDLNGGSLYIDPSTEATLDIGKRLSLSGGSFISQSGTAAVALPSSADLSISGTVHLDGIGLSTVTVPESLNTTTLSGSLQVSGESYLNLGSHGTQIANFSVALDGEPAAHLPITIAGLCDMQTADPATPALILGPGAPLEITGRTELHGDLTSVETVQVTHQGALILARPTTSHMIDDQLRLDPAPTITGDCAVIAGLLGGSGTITGGLSAGNEATIQPGGADLGFTAPASLAIGGDLVMDETATLHVRLRNSGCDSLVVQGAITLGQLDLALIPDRLGAMPGTVFTLIGNPNGHTITGTFWDVHAYNYLAEGDTITLGDGTVLAISYQAGVTLTVKTVQPLACIAISSAPWNQGSTWDGGKVPSAIDTATIPVVYTVTIDDAQSVGCLVVNGWVDISGAASLAIAGTNVEGGSAINGTLNIGGTGSLLIDDETVEVGGTINLGSAGGSGSIRIAGSHGQVPASVLNINGGRLQTPLSGQGLVADRGDWGAGSVQVNGGAVIDLGQDGMEVRIPLTITDGTLVGQGIIANLAMSPQGHGIFQPGSTVAPGRVTLTGGGGLEGYGNTLSLRLNVSGGGGILDNDRLSLATDAYVQTTNSSLAISLMPGSEPLVSGQQFTLIDSADPDHPGAIKGTFAGLPQDASFQFLVGEAYWIGTVHYVPGPGIYPRSMTLTINALGNYQWTNPGQGDWEVSSNWYGGPPPPGANDLVSIENGGTCKATGAHQAFSLITSHGSTLALAPGGTLAIGYNLTCNGGIIKGGTITITGTGNGATAFYLIGTPDPCTLDGVTLRMSGIGELRGLLQVKSTNELRLGRAYLTNLEIRPDAGAVTTCWLEDYDLIQTTDSQLPALTLGDGTTLAVSFVTEIRGTIVTHLPVVVDGQYAQLALERQSDSTASCIDGNCQVTRGQVFFNDGRITGQLSLAGAGTGLRATLNFGANEPATRLVIGNGLHMGPGSGYTCRLLDATTADVLEITGGTVDLANLTVSSLPAVVGAPSGTVWTIISSAVPITTPFTGLPAGSLVDVGQESPARISYAGGNGHDVTLTLGTGPLPQKIRGFNAFAAHLTNEGPFAITGVTGGESASPVVFASSDTAVATISGTTVSIHGAGTTTITATQDGAGNFLAATPVARVLTVTSSDIPQVITGFTALGNQTYGDAPFTIIGVSGGGSSRPVVFTSSDTAVATISGTVVTIRGAGTTTITATQAGEGDYTAATPVAQILNVAKAPAITATATDARRAFGTGNPPFRGILIGVVNGDAISAAYTSSAGASTAIGVYGTDSAQAITPVITDATGRLANYLGSSTSKGSLTITAAAPLTQITASAAAPLPVGRFFHTALTLPSGRILVTGGATDSYSDIHHFTKLASCIVYDPTTGTWSDFGAPMLYARHSHTATLLPSGKILVTGGVASGIEGDYTNCEMYDPGTGAWHEVAPLPGWGGLNHAATLLPDGRVLVSGGRPGYGSSHACFIYDPMADLWTAATDMPAGQFGHSAILLSSGKVLVAGGDDSISGGVNACASYDPTHDIWTTSGALLAHERFFHGATLLTTGQVLLAGGADASYDQAQSSCEIYDPVTDTSAALGSLAIARSGLASALLPSGQVLVIGGRDSLANGRTVFASCEILSVTPPSAPVISTASLANGRLGTAYHQILAATGSPTFWVVTSGHLPDGMVLGHDSGEISGTPTTAGTAAFTVTAANAGGTSAATGLAITVLGPSPVIGATSLMGGRVGVAYEQTLTATNGPTAWAVISGGLPAGVTLDPVTGTISGVPTTAGSSTFTVTATNAGGTSAGQGFGITIVPPFPVISTTSLPNGVVDVAYRQVLAASNDPTSWTILNGSLPAGLALNAATGEISGIPIGAGMSEFTVLAANAGGAKDGQTLQLTIVPQPPVISTTSLPGGRQGIAYEQTLVATGNPTTWVMISGDLPAGLALNPASGVISGMPTAVGTGTFTVTAANAGGTSSGQPLSIAIVPQSPVITTTTLPDGTVASAYQQNLTATNNPTSWVITSGSLPAGLILGPDSGEISGMPTMVGTATFTVTAANAGGTGTAQALSITILPQRPVISTAQLPDGKVGTPYQQTLMASNGPTAWNLVGGDLPPGLNLDAATGVISGTPTTRRDAGFSFAVTATNAGGTSLSNRWLTIRIIPQPPVISTTGLPDAVVATDYLQVLAATDGPVLWAITRGTLPPGLDLVPETGVISGTPTISGSFICTVTATNEGGTSADQELRITAVIPGVSTIGLMTGRQSVVEGDAGTTPVTVTVRRLGGSGGTASVAWQTRPGTALPFTTTDIRAIAAGAYHTVALKNDGTVVAWGDHDAGQTAVPAGLSGVIAIAAGAYHSVALKADGTVVAWGANESGQTTVPADLGRVIAIAAAGSHTVALLHSQTVVAWGANESGQTAVPAGLGGVKAIAAGSAHTVALLSNGTVVAWGGNASGQATVPTDLDGIRAIAAGSRNTVALTTGGLLVSWGDRGSNAVNISNQRFTIIAAGPGCTAALTTDGQWFRWGDSIPVPEYVHATTSTMAFGDRHLAILEGDGAVNVWGDNSRGQSSTATTADFIAASGTLTWDNGDTTDKTFTVSVQGDTETEADESFSVILSSPSAGTILGTASQTITIVNDDTASTIALTTDHQQMDEGNAGTTPLTVTVHRAGPSNGAVSVDWATQPGTASPSTDYLAASGTLTWADGDAADKAFTVDVLGDIISESSETFSIVLSNLTGHAVLGTSTQTVTITDDDTGGGTIGFSVARQSVKEGDPVGTDTRTTMTVTVRRTGGSVGPVHVSYKTGWGTALPFATTDVRSLVGGGTALKNDGTVVTWGGNADPAITAPDGLSRIGAIAVDGGHTLGLRLDGTVVAWGNNDSGQADVPAGLGGVRAIAAGATYSLALKDDGTVVAWGQPYYCAVPAGLAGVTALSSSHTHTVALKSDGTVVAWGLNDHGQTDVPADLRGVTAIATADGTTLALKNDGTVVAWGDNTYGQTNVPADLREVASIHAGALGGAALKRDGTVVAWGDNSHGQTAVPAGLGDVISVSVGNGHTVALKRDGTVVAWGYDNHGQTNVPAGLAGVAAIHAGTMSTTVLKRDGSVVAWGDNTVLQSCTAAAPDYDIASGSLDWGDHDEADKTFTINVRNDLLIEPDEWFTVRLYGISGNAVLGTSTQTITITNDDGNDIVAPSWQSTPGTVAVTGRAWEYAAGVVAGRGSTLPTLEGSDLPSWITLSQQDVGRWRLSGTPPQPGSYRVVLRVTNGGIDAKIQDFTIVAVPAAITRVTTPRIATLIDGLPAPYTALNLATEEGVAAFRAAMAGKDITQVRGFAWDPAINDYVEFPQEPVGGLTPFHAVFLVTRVQLDLPLGGVPLAMPATLIIKPGWNFIGIPPLHDGTAVQTSHPWEMFHPQDLEGMPITGDIATNLLGTVGSGDPATTRPWLWNGEGYVQVDTLATGVGYWIKNNGTVDIHLIRRSDPVQVVPALVQRALRTEDRTAEAGLQDRGQPPAPPSQGAGTGSSQETVSGSGGCGLGSGAAFLGLLLFLLRLQLRGPRWR